ncbi:MAG: polyprenyl synthetase family protein [Eubacteriales bacterium]
MIHIEEKLRASAQRTEELLSEMTAHAASSYPVLNEAMRYSLLSGGKRIRPFLVSAFSDLFGGDEAIAQKLGCALEMIHTYSLIHDDLPCMDNDDLRRGKPTNHKVYGEAAATLAGDALLRLAFEAASDPALPSDTALASIRILAKNAGRDGMIGGQMIDLRGEEERLDFDLLLEMHAKKTGALMEAACLLGCFSAKITSPDDIRYQAAVRYAHDVGLAFQIIDDRLDAIGSEATLGKPIGSDAVSGKTTFLTFMSPDQALDYAKDLTGQAKEAVAAFHGSETLCALADFLLNRNK